MKNKKLTMLLAATMTGMLLLTPSAKASLTCSSSNAQKYTGSLSSLGSCVYEYDYTGVCSGSLKNSYNCGYYTTTCDLSYKGGQVASNPTCLVLEDSKGNCYIWNCSTLGWNGTQQCSFQNICGYGDRITCIEFYCGNPPNPKVSSVPEPSTVVAGVLMLLPLGVSALRVFRRKQAAQNI